MIKCLFNYNNNNLRVFGKVNPPGTEVLMHLQPGATQLVLIGIIRKN